LSTAKSHDSPKLDAISYSSRATFREISLFLVRYSQDSSSSMEFKC